MQQRMVPPCPNGRYYTVKQNDTLMGIAKSFGITLYALTEKNPYIDPGRLFVGQLLCIPNPAVSPPAQTPPGLLQIAPSAGQSVYDLLVQYEISYGALAGANPHTDVMHLKEGTLLFIPPRGARICPPGKRMYILRPGDTLASLAAAQGVAPQALLLANPCLLAGDFVPGQPVCLPDV